MLSVWYHLYSAGNWREPVDEFLDALGDYPSDKPINIGLVGSPEQRTEAANYIAEQRLVNIVAEKEKGWEQVTLIPLSRWVRRHGGLVLYAHTKGAASSEPIAAPWRRSMTELVVRNHAKNCSQIYTKGYDIVTTHWLLPEQWQGLLTSPIAGGNFWIARAGFLRTLPPVPTRTRMGAEEWIGLRRQRPFVCDLKPGWPSFQLFGEQVKEAV